MTYLGIFVAAVVVPAVLLVIACACVIVDERGHDDAGEQHPAGRDL